MRRRGSRTRLAGVLVAVAVLATACHVAPPLDPESERSESQGTPLTADPAKAEAVRAVVESVRASSHLRAVIVRVTSGDQEILTEAVGESMTGVPATTAMHFRNGAVAISYVATLALLLEEQGALSLDDKVSQYLPDLRYADRVTIGQLAQMTSGYADYVADPLMADAQYAEPFRPWTPEELIAYSTGKPLVYAPGTNWNYSHTNYVILGLVIEKATGRSVDDLLQEKVLGPLGLENTEDPGTAAIPEPALHAFTSERREFLKLKPGEPFIEESTYWNPSWTITRGAVQTTNIFDLNTTAHAIGSGRLLKPESYQKMITRDLIGKTTAIDGCPTCFPQSVGYSYGLGIVTSGSWVLQNPLFSGAAGAFGYHPPTRTSIAVAVTFEPEAFDPATGGYANAADQLWRLIGETVVPDDPPPIRR
ncbi:serine hydrolase domain-containing protein [Microlunatus aurantiacus]|uniref:Serine hydrolase domain-containing protein n=1 Tax=Microlunatus aurantiacus TaxID=446786 RepID=A0ABP7DIJ6_9ACTN